MGVWTIAAQAGTGGLEIATGLAARAGVPLVDRKALLHLAHELQPDVNENDDIEARVGGRLMAFALSAACAAGAPDAFRELRLRHDLPAIGHTVIEQAARCPAVIFAPAAFAAIRDHPWAVHVRLRAPFEWRVAAYQREELVDHRSAAKAVRHDDDHKRTWTRTLYHVDIDDQTNYSLVVDVSRFPADRVVDMLLAAAASKAAV
jgi:cytidylate kinase